MGSGGVRAVVVRPPKGDIRHRPRLVVDAGVLSVFVAVLLALGGYLFFRIQV